MKSLVEQMRHARIRVGTRRFCATLIGAALAAQWSTVAADQPTETLPDRVHDEVARRTDPGGDGPLDPVLHRLIDLRELTLARWAPAAPESDLFSGSAAGDGEYFRLDVVLSGLVNPPGSTHPAFAPFAFGDHPVYGFIEIDMDDDTETGGEIEAPQYRYLGNIVRFGGMPSDETFEDRVARSGSDFDDDFESEPLVERHGEEFHLALLGGQFSIGDLVVVSGDSDAVFEAGEIWHIPGRWFHRAHGFEPFSFAQGGTRPGEYAPICEVQFQHDAENNVTSISLVFPLTNVGAGLARGEPPEPIDFDPSNHASVMEALSDLVFSASFFEPPFGEPEEDIIYGWHDKDPERFLPPAAWRATALVGTSYTMPDPEGIYYAWTDALPDVTRGDVDGERGVDEDDREAIEEFIEERDASDGTVDGAVTILDFASDFSVYDVNHDGRVDAVDVVLVCRTGDLDDDGLISLSDYGMLQICFSGSGLAYDAEQCAPADLDSDGDVDLRDFEWFQSLLRGPGQGG